MKRRTNPVELVADSPPGGGRRADRPRTGPRLLAWALVLVFAAGAVLLLERALAPPLAAAAQEDELETFVPSEELPADAAVSFPVDI